MGNQTPTPREVLSRSFHKQKEDIKELFYTGDVQKGVETIINFIAFSNPIYEIVSTLAVAKACEILETKKLGDIKESIKEKSIQISPASFVTKEAIKYAENQVKTTLDPKSRNRLENSLIGAIKSRLEK
jgi:hypothetical protein